MCTISNKLKLCACKAKNVYSLKNYWVLHRFVGDKGEYIMGEAMMPTHNPLIDKKLNERVLLSLLNEQNIFDAGVDIQEKDLLHLVFNQERHSENYDEYGFEFIKGLWTRADYNVFEWMERHEEILWGKIVHCAQ